MAKVATSAKEARELGFLRPWDRITIQRDFLLQEAKNTVLAMNREGYEAPRPRTDIALPGRSEFSTFAYALYAMRVGGQISEDDELLGRKIAFVMTGGNVPRGARRAEQDLLDFQREGVILVVVR